MNARKKRLGRGLDALLSNSAATTEAASTSPDKPAIPAGERLMKLPLDLLTRGQYQPRNDMRQDSLEELADSIRSQGVVQPIVVRPVGKTGNSERYEIIAGERRWRAAQIAGLAEIPAVIRDVEDEDAIAMALIENIQRENLNPHAEAATAVGRSRASVSNLLRLQELSDKVKALLEERKLDMGHARALLSIQSPVQQLDVARQIVKQGLSVRAAEKLVRRALAPPPENKKPPAANADVRRLEIEVSEKLGAKVSVQHTQKGTGKLVISYNSLDELDGILKHIK